MHIGRMAPFKEIDRKDLQENDVVVALECVVATADAEERKSRRRVRSKIRTRNGICLRRHASCAASPQLMFSQHFQCLEPVIPSICQLFGYEIASMRPFCRCLPRRRHAENVQQPRNRKDYTLIIQCASSTTSSALVGFEPQSRIGGDPSGPLRHFSRY